jgi:hypothetical protein
MIWIILLIVLLIISSAILFFYTTVDIAKSKIAQEETKELQEQQRSLKYEEALRDQEYRQALRYEEALRAQELRQALKEKARAEIKLNEEIKEHMTQTVTNECVGECLTTHSVRGLNYPWLNDIHGGLMKIQYMEPPISGQWVDYTDDVWSTHCSLISHNPDTLVDEHINAFVNPDTRFARLQFIFNDGTVIQLEDMDTANDFYTREADYFRENNICT